MWLFTDEDSGMRRSQLVNWYLEDIENEIDSEAELVERKTIVEKVIYRLIHHVCLAEISFCTYHWPKCCAFSFRTVCSNQSFSKSAEHVISGHLSNSVHNRYFLSFFPVD